LRGKSLCNMMAHKAGCARKEYLHAWVRAEIPF
jgi:hypothetical protein